MADRFAFAVEVLKEYVVRFFTSMDVPDIDARIAADVLVSADPYKGERDWTLGAVDIKTSPASYDRSDLATDQGEPSYNPDSSGESGCVHAIPINRESRFCIFPHLDQRHESNVHRTIP